MRRVFRAKALNSLLALVLAIIMVVSIVPLQVLASFVEDGEDGEVEELIAAQSGSVELEELAGDIDLCDDCDEADCKICNPADNPNETTPPSNEPATVNFWLLRGDTEPVETRRIAVGGTFSAAYPTVALPVAESGARATRITGWEDEAGNEFVFNYEVEAREVINLYARFEWIYLIKFRTQPGATEIYYSVERSEGQLIPQLSPDQVRELTASIYNDDADAWHIEFWYDESISPPAAFGFGVVGATKDMTLVPQWRQAHLVNFETEGRYVDPMLVKHGESIVTQPVSTRQGYTFNGWTYDEERLIPYNGEEITSSITLYARWTPVEVGYTIVYWLERPNVSGDPGTNHDNYMFHSSHTARALSGTTITPVRSAYPNLTVVERQSDTLSFILPIAEFRHGVPEVVLGNGTTVVNVYFNRIVYTYNFNLGSAGQIQFKNPVTGQLVGSPHSQSGSTGPAYSFTAKYEQNITDLWPSSKNANTTRDAGSSFTSWTRPGGNQSVIASTANFVSHQLTVSNFLVPHNGSRIVNLTAGWGSTDTRQVNYLIERTREQLEGTGEQRNIASTGNKWYVVDSNHSQQMALSGGLGQKAITGTAIVGTRHMNSAGTGTTTSVMPASVSTYNFYYTRNLWNVEFNSMGGTLATGSYTTVSRNIAYSTRAVGNMTIIPDVMFGERLGFYGEDFNTRFVPTRAAQDGVEFIFGGWYLDRGCNEPFNPSNMTMPNGNLGLFAKWITKDFAVRWYDDTFNPGFISESAIPDNGDGWGEVQPTHSPYTVGQIVPGKGEFAGWFLIINNVPTPYEIPARIRTNISLYAGWNIDYFTLRFNTGEGTIDGEENAIYDDGDTYALGAKARIDSGLRITPPAGKQLVGWTVDYEGMPEAEKGVLHQPYALYTMPGNVVMTAVYADLGDLVRVIYHSNYPPNTRLPEARPHWAVDKEQNVTLWGAIYDLPGAQHIGWDENPNAVTPQYPFPEPHGVATNSITEMELFNGIDARTLNLHAIWRTNVYTVEFYTTNGGFLRVGSEPSPLIPEHAVGGITGGTIWSLAIDPMPVPVPNADFYFAGWTQNPGSIGQQNLNADPIDGDFPIVSDMVFVAHFALRPQVSISSPNATKVYDGTPLTNTNYLYNNADLASGHEWRPTHNPLATITNVGPSVLNSFDAIIVDTNNSDIDVSYQYRITKTEGNLNINPRPVTITANSAGPFEYDGTLKSVTGFTVSPTTDIAGLVLDHKFDVTDVTLTGGTGTDVGTHPHNITGWTISDGAGEPVPAINYTVTPVNGNLTITSRPLTVTANSDELEYNGADQSVTGVITVGLVEGHYLVQEGLTAGGTGRNVVDGPYAHTVGTVEVRDASGADVTRNYALTTHNGALTITQVDLLIEAFINGKKAENVLRDYEGTFELTYVATLFRGNDADSYELEAEWVTEPAKINGLYPLTSFTAIIADQDDIVARLPIQGNYNVTFEDATLTIDDLNRFGFMDLVATPGGGIYRGNDYLPSFSTRNAPASATPTYAYLENGVWNEVAGQIDLGRTDVGTTIVRATLSAPGYYPVTRTTFVTVLPRPIVVTANSSLGNEYDGALHEAIGISDIIGGMRLVQGESIVDFDTRVSETEVGTYDHILYRRAITILGAPDEDGKRANTTHNYVIVTVNGELEILPLEITIAPLPGEKFYGEEDPEEMASVMIVNGEETTLEAFNELDMEDFWYYADREEGENVRFGYPVYVSTGEKEFHNYIVNVNNPEDPQEVTFDIKQVPLTVRANNVVNVVAGTPVEDLTFTVSFLGDLQFDDEYDVIEIDEEVFGLFHNYNTSREAGWSDDIIPNEDAYSVKVVSDYELPNYYLEFEEGLINVIAPPELPPVVIPPPEEETPPDDGTPPADDPPADPPADEDVPPLVPAVVPPADPPAEPPTADIETPPIPVAAGPVGGTPADPGTPASNPIQAIIDGNIPLASFDGAWSLLNLLMSLTAGFVMISLFGTLLRRKKEEHFYDDDDTDEDTKKRIKFRERLNSLRIPALIAASIPGMLFLVFENIRLPVVWITRWTPLIGAFFLISSALLITYLVISKRAKIADQDNEEEAAETTEA